MSKLPILVVEDDPDLLEALCTTLGLEGYAYLAAPDGEQALELLATHPVGLVVSDVQMHPMDGLTLLQAIRQEHPGIPVMLMTAFGEVEKAVAAMQAGACDYLQKPFAADSLLAQIERYLPPVVKNEYAGIVAEDPHMLAVLTLAKKVADTSATVMLTGESGSGKEVLARFIHQHSSRAQQSFVAINCAAIPENLLEATLFGYEKGAFTGATQAQAGKFEQANGGTLLLDEISEMSLNLQAKLLRVLQECEVERVGGKKPIKLDFRLLATSNRDMRAHVQSGGFREDLYYRLNVFPLTIPPLRERPQDIIPLAQRMLSRAERETLPQCFLTESAIRALQKYSWPGNVRELENMIQRAMILAAGPIESKHLNLPELAVDNVNKKGISSLRDIKSLEREHILQTLAAVNGSRKLAVQKLGISERTLRYKLQQYRLAECVE